MFSFFLCLFVYSPFLFFFFFSFILHDDTCHH